MMSWIGLHKFGDVIFGITQKLLHVTSSTNSIRHIKLHIKLYKPKLTLLSYQTAFETKTRSMLAEQI